jgi:hypothetical protein
MRIEISSEPRRGSARSRTDNGLRTERLLIDQIDSGVFAALSDMALRLCQARDQSDFQLAGERKESDKELLRVTKNSSGSRAHGTPPSRRWPIGRTCSPHLHTTGRAS